MATPFLADLHVHSPYAFACSKGLTVENLAAWAKIKGINLLATGDFTHPVWAESLRNQLDDGGDGLYAYDGVRFVPGTEISCVYKQDGRGRRIHLLALMPTLEAAGVFTNRLARFGKLESDGRPTVSLSARGLAELALEVSAEAVIIPAHAWTPWYGLYGSRSGFDSLEECFGDLAAEITAVESGLSADPAMTGGVPDLQTRSTVSFSDAHSLGRLGRELTAFDAPLSWTGLRTALRESGVAYTVEFYPEEGKYHYSGHRKCGVAYDGAALARQGPVCPVCGRMLTLGVLHRVGALSGPAVSGAIVSGAPGPDGDGFVRSGHGGPPFARLIPLQEIIGAVRNVGANSRTVQREYAGIIDSVGSELAALLFASAGNLQAAAAEDVAAAILDARAGNVDITPGFDGQYGSIRLR